MPLLTESQRSDSRFLSFKPPHTALTSGEMTSVLSTLNKFLNLLKNYTYLLVIQPVLLSSRGSNKLIQEIALIN